MSLALVPLHLSTIILGEQISLLSSPNLTVDNKIVDYPAKCNLIRLTRIAPFLEEYISQHRYHEEKYSDTFLFCTEMTIKYRKSFGKSSLFTCEKYLFVAYLRKNLCHLTSQALTGSNISNNVSKSYPTPSYNLYNGLIVPPDTTTPLILHLIWYIYYSLSVCTAT